MISVPLSILDLAAVAKGESIAATFAGSVRLAQCAERAGYKRVWYAEHHNISSIASSATAVLIAHIAANTEKIRVGAGGIMLPNHSPLQIAEQFGTLETLHPGRIDLGLGRAPGSDEPTARALRRNPAALHDAIALYRERFKPSAQLETPYVIAGVGVIAADSSEAAAEQFQAARRLRARALFSRGGQKLSAEDVEAILQSPQAAVVDEMLTYTAVGAADEAAAYLERFQQQTGADELITVHYNDSVENRLRSVELLAGAALGTN